MANSQHQVILSLGTEKHLFILPGVVISEFPSGRMNHGVFHCGGKLL